MLPFPVVVSPARTRILVVGGRDRLRFLHAVTTQDVAKLAPGEGAHGALTDDRGRPVSDFRLYVLPEAVLLELPSGAAEGLRAALGRLIIADDVALAWADGETVTREAPDAASLRAALDGPRRARGWFMPPLEALDDAAPAVGWNGNVTATTPEDEAALAAVPRVLEAVLRASRFGGIGAFDWSGPASGSTRPETLDALEIDAGHPGPAEFAEARVWNELGMMDVVSFTKGCFMGQEILNRVHAQGQLQRRLVTLELDGEGAWQGASLFTAEGEPAGVITRAALLSPRTNARAFAFVLRGAWEAGTRLEARRGPDRGEATVRGPLSVEVP